MISTFVGLNEDKARTQWEKTDVYPNKYYYLVSRTREMFSHSDLVEVFFYNIEQILSIEASSTHSIF